MKNPLSKFTTHCFKSNSKWFIPITAFLLVLFCVLISTVTYAEAPESAQIVKLQGAGIMFREGEQRSKAATEGMQLLNNNQALIVPGNNNSWSKLAFITPPPPDSARFEVQAGPDIAPTTYQFPCKTDKGLVIVSWHQGDDRGCELEGIRLASPRRSNAQLPNSNLIAQKNYKASQIAQAADDVTVKPDSSEPKLFRGQVSDRVEVVPIIGNVNVFSAQFPQGQTLRPGQRYTYLGNGQGSIDPVDLASIINSPPVQNFLNSNSWSSPQLPPRVTKALSPLIANHRAALGLPPDRIAEPVLGTGDVQLTLRWSTTDDIDLAVTAPTGEIVSYGNKIVTSGGELDVDTNPGCSNSSATPIENIYWPSSKAPSGQYKAEVNLFKRCGSTTGPVQFTLTIRVKGREQTQTGTVSVENQPASFSFSFP